MRFIVDRPHSRSHVDVDCKRFCFPTVPENEAALGSFPTPICESVNSRLSPLAHTVHHMGRWVCMFSVTECVDVHNTLLMADASRSKERAGRRAARAELRAASAVTSSTD